MNNNQSIKTVHSSFSKFDLLIVIGSLMLVLIFSACQNESSSSNSTEISDAEILSYLEDLGYHAHHVSIEGEHILYEDVVIDRQSIISAIHHPITEELDEDLPMEVDSRQRGVGITHALTNANSKSGLKIYIASSIQQDVGSKTKQAILDAIDAINDITYTTLNLEVVYQKSVADIVIASDLDLTIFTTDSPFYTIPTNSALANLSFYGMAGPRISVDPGWENFNQNTIKSGMMHELGHTIGLYHTGGDSGEHIHHTPEDNVNSIMNPIAITSGQFSWWDKKAIRMYYTNLLKKPTSLKLTKNGSTATIKYTNPSKTYRPYYWVRVYRYHPGGGLDTFKDFPADVVQSTGRGTVIWSNQPTGNYKYRVKAMRLRKDVKSKISVAVTAN